MTDSTKKTIGFMTPKKFTVDNTKGKEDIMKKLSNLKPTKELLDYYRRKISQFDAEHEDFLKKLELYKQTSDNRYQLEQNLKQRDEDIMKLQKALSDMQMYLFQERDQVMKLNSENEMLKIQKTEDRQKIELLLMLANTTEEKLVHVLQNQRGKPLLQPKLPPQLQKLKGYNVQESRYSCSDVETLRLYIISLEEQLDEERLYMQEKVQAFTDEQKVIQEERQVEHRRDAQEILRLSKKVKETEDILYDTTKDFLKTKDNHRRIECTLLAEKDKLLRDIQFYKDQVVVMPLYEGGDQADRSPLKSGLLHSLPQRHATEQQLKKQIMDLKSQLTETTQVCDMYREQCVGLDAEMSRLRESAEGNRELFKERIEKMRSQINTLKKNCEEADRRRRLEASGFHSDIKILREALRSAEKNFYKFIISLGQSEELQSLDIKMLDSLQKSGETTKKLQHELKDIKAKIYTLEDNLRLVY